MKIVVVDLDDTLISTSDLKQELFDIISAVGVPREEVDNLYQSSKDGNGIPIIDNLVKKVAENYQGVDREALRGSLDTMYSCIGEERLLLDRLAVLEERYPRSEYKYVLVTKGEADIQERKISAFRLRAVFDEVKVVNGPKVEFLRELAGEIEGLVFVDDKESEREAVLAELKSEGLVVIDPLELDETRESDQAGEEKIEEGPSFREG